MKLYIILLALLLLAITTKSTKATTYHVGYDGDYTTLTQVNAATFVAGDSILFKRGQVFSGELLVNSGTSANPITYSAYGTGSNPVITGFTQVTSWVNLGNNIWESSTAVSTLSYLNIVLINGVNTAMGRTPNSGSVYTAQTHNANLSITSSQLTGTPDWTGAQVVIRKTPWTWQTGTVSSQTGGTINYTDEGTFTPADNCGFFFQADIKTLDQQNEWYYNPSTKKLTIYSTSQPTNVFVPTYNTLIDCYNKHYITIENLSITGANQRGINVNTCSNFRIANNIINKCGLEGIAFNNTATYTIDGNTIKNCNYSAIFTYAASQPNSGEIITNNTIDSTYMIIGIGRLYSPNAIHSNTNNTLIQYNRIDHSGYGGIICNCLTGQVKNNFINNSLLNRSDGGGIYVTIETTNLIIDGNVIINSTGYPLGEPNNYNGARGIYLDSNSQKITVSNNTIAHCWDGIYLNSGSDQNIISGNLVYDCTKSQLSFNNSTQGAGSINNNVVTNNQFIAKRINTGIQWYDDQMALNFNSLYDDVSTFISSASNNIYARPIDDTNTIRIVQPSTSGDTYKTLEFWKTFSGLDGNSKKSPISVASENDILFYYNYSNEPVIQPLPFACINLYTTKYPSIYTLQPYSSVVLLKDPNPLQPATQNKVIKYRNKILGIKQQNIIFGF